MAQPYGGGSGVMDTQTSSANLAVAAESRHERQLMRQRGAGNRTINNVDFGFAFGTPSTVGRTPARARTRSQTPTAISRPVNLDTSNDIVPSQGLIDPRLLTRNHPPSSTRSVRSVRLPESTSVPFVRPSPAKRRRISEYSDQVIVGTSPAHLPAAVAEELEVEESIVALLNSNSEAHNRSIVRYRSTSQDPGRDVPSSPLFFDHNTETPIMVSNQNKENEGPAGSGSSNKKSVKRSKRKSIGQQSLFKRKRKSSSVQPLPTPSDTQDSIEPPLTSSISVARQGPVRKRRWSVASSSDASRSVAPRLPPATNNRERSPVTESLAAVPQRTDSPVSKTQHKKRKKRKSVVLGPKRRSTSKASNSSTSPAVVQSIETDEAPTLNDDGAEFSLNELSLDVPEPTLLEDDDAELETSHLQPTTIYGPTNSKPLPQISQDAVDDDDNDDDGTYLPGEESPGPTPAPKRKKKPPRARRRSATSEADRDVPHVSVARPTRLHSGYPVVMHRMTNSRALPTIAEEPDSDQASEDELATLPPSFTNRKQPNAVDILAQACREQVENTISSIQSSSLPRADQNKRLNVLVMFRDNLEDRLFDVSQALDHRLTMEARIRQAKREKAALQNEWLETRRQRDMLDLKKDAIRRKHWENEILSRKRFETSEAAFAVGELLDNEHDGEVNDLEIRIREAAGFASSTNKGGALNQIKDFNARLEKLAMKLG